MEVRQVDGRTLFIVRPGERFKHLKWLWLSFLIGWRRGWRGER